MDLTKKLEPKRLDGQRPGSGARLLRGLAALIVATAVPITAGARDQSDDGEVVIEELVVVAERYVSTGGRSANKDNIPLVETPQSVSIISRDMIDLLNWNSLNESMRYVSGATGEAFGPDERYDWLQVRGFDPVQFIDGVRAPIASVNNTAVDLYGFESVEVLKGPASGLYGQAPPGGIVNVTSRRPTEEFSSELEVQLGEYDHVQLNGDITGALSDTVSARFTALYRDRETQVDFLTSERFFVAPAIAFELTPVTSLTLLANYQDDRLENQSTGFLPAFGTSLPNPVGTVPVGRNLGETGVNFFDRTQFSVGYEFSHEFSGSFAIEQNFKYFDVDVDSRAVFGAGLVDDNFDGTPDDFRTVNRFDFPFNEDIQTTNIDTRAVLTFATGALDHSMLVGIDYRHYDGFSEFGFNEAPQIDLFEPVYDAEIPEGPVFPSVDATIDQLGLYVQDQIRVDNFVVTLTGRLDNVDTDPANGDETDDEEFTYRVGLNYVFDNGLSPYLQTARSFEPAQGADFNGNLFEPTTGTQYEVGLKYDGRNLARGLNVFASIAAYQVVQENLTTPDPDNVGFNVQTGEVEVQGVELELAARLNERLTVNFAYTSTDTEVTKSNSGNLGKSLVAVPDTIVSALVNYTIQTGTFGGLGAGIGIRHRGEQFGDALNEWPSDSVTLWDAIIHYDTENWRFALNANNFTDKTYVDRCSSTSNCFYGVRRLVIGSLTRKF